MTPNQFSVGQRIQARDPSGNAWRNAIVSKLAPYRGKPGYYIHWDPLPREQWQSIGGWTYEAVMRTRRPSVPTQRHWLDHAPGGTHL